MPQIAYLSVVLQLQSQHCCQSVDRLVGQPTRSVHKTMKVRRIDFCRDTDLVARQVRLCDESPQLVAEHFRLLCAFLRHLLFLLIVRQLNDISALASSQCSVCLSFCAAHCDSVRRRHLTAVLRHGIAFCIKMATRHAGTRSAHFSGGRAPILRRVARTNARGYHAPPPSCWLAIQLRSSSTG
jgi:hypothetical protein